MPSPSTTLLGLRPELGTEFAEFDLEISRQKFIAYKVFPVFAAKQVTGVVPRIPIKELLKRQSAVRASDGTYSRGKIHFTTYTYLCQEYGLEEPIDEREAKIYGDYFPAEQTATARVARALACEAEIRMAGKVFDPTVWTGESLTDAVTHEWDDYQNADPVGDVTAAMKIIYRNSGTHPNALIVNYNSFLDLKNCEKIHDRITSQGAGGSISADDIDEQVLARVLGLKHLLVAGGTYNTAKEGQDFAGGDIWDGEYAMVCRVAESDDLREICIGRTFHYTEDGGGLGGVPEVYRDDKARANIVRVRHDVDEKVLFPQAGFLLSNIKTVGG